MISTLIPRDLVAWLPSGADGTDDEDTGDDTKNVPDDTDGEEKDNVDENDDSSGTVSKAELEALQKKFNQMRLQLSAADKNKSDAQKKLDDLQRKERTDLENAQADVTKAQEETRLAQEEGDGWKTKYLGLARTNAFLISSAQLKINWHDPQVAQAIANLDGLEVDDDGTVTGLDVLIKKLAKDKPFLVNTEGADGDGEETRPRSGARVGSRGKKDQGTKNGLSREEILKRFPALRQ